MSKRRKRIEPERRDGGDRSRPVVRGETMRDVCGALRLGRTVLIVFADKILAVNGLTSQDQVGQQHSRCTHGAPREAPPSDEGGALDET